MTNGKAAKSENNNRKDAAKANSDTSCHDDEEGHQKMANEDPSRMDGIGEWS